MYLGRVGWGDQKRKPPNQFHYLLEVFLLLHPLSASLFVVCSRCFFHYTKAGTTRVSFVMAPWRLLIKLFFMSMMPTCTWNLRGETNAFNFFIYSHCSGYSSSLPCVICHLPAKSISRSYSWPPIL